MSQSHDVKGSKVAPKPLPTTDFDLVWETKSFNVQTSGAPAPFPIKVLHGYRRYNIDYVVSPEADHQTVLAVHGLMHNALVFQPLGHELLKDLNKKTHHFYSISLPGHGDMTPGSSHGVSGTPGHKLYGEVTLADYAEALTQVAQQIGLVDTIVAHSQGGIVVQLAEKMLQLASSSFLAQRQTSRIVLIASTMPAEVQWDAADNGSLAQTLATLNAVQMTSGKGTFLSITDDVWNGLFYSYSVPPNPPGPVTGGPNLTTQVPKLRTDEPSSAPFQSLGPWLGQPRPSIPPNLFQHYLLHNIAFQEDAFITPVDLNRLGSYLKPGLGHILIASLPGAPAIHCALYTRPASLVPYLVGLGDTI